MKLQDSLFSVLQHTAAEGAHDYTIRLNSEHVIYKAHFPEQPITPGVCIIQIAQELLEDVMNKPLSITMVKNVKFLQIISPNDTSSVCYTLHNIVEEENTVKVQVKVTQGETVYAKLSFVCQITA